MALVTKNNTFSTGAVIKAAEHNDNFDTLYNDYNGNITNANIAAAAAIAGTKLDLTSVGAVGSTSASTGKFTTLQTTDNITLGGSNKELRFMEGANYVGFEAPALTADQIWVLPTADGSAGEALATDGSGTLSWVETGLGAWTTGTKDTSTLAATDLILVVVGTQDGSGDGGEITVKTDAANPPTTVRGRSYIGVTNASWTTTVTVPVKKGDYWLVEDSGGVDVTTIYQIPLGE